MHLVHVPVRSPAEADDVAGRLWLHEPIAVEDRGSELVAGFASIDVAMEVATELGGRVVEPPAAESWRDAWRQHAEPVRVGRVVIVPAWLEAPGVSGNDVVVRVDPGAAFGTGSHPSTRLLVARLQTLGGDDLSLLDVGCGSGVLAITAARLGFARLVAVDTALEAVAATTENARVNDVEVDVRAGSVDVVDGAFDVVVANIGAQVLRSMAGPLVARVRPGGTLALAGLLDQQVADVVAAFARAGTRLAGLESEDGWAAPVLVREV